MKYNKKNDSNIVTLFVQLIFAQFVDMLSWSNSKRGIFLLSFMHGVKRYPTWTVLKETAEKGSDKITLNEKVDWKVGELIAIASTRRSDGLESVQAISVVIVVFILRGALFAVAMFALLFRARARART